MPYKLARAEMVKIKKGGFMLARNEIIKNKLTTECVSTQKQAKHEEIIQAVINLERTCDNIEGFYRGLIGDKQTEGSGLKEDCVDKFCFADVINTLSNRLANTNNRLNALFENIRDIVL